MERQQGASPKVFAVLTGDLVASERLSAAALDAALATLGDAAARYGKTHDMALRFTRFRGDGWQVLLDTPGLCLEASLYMTARLAGAHPGLSTRIATGLGPVEAFGTADLSDARGEAFTTSGRQLDGMTGADRLSLCRTERAGGGYQQAIFQLAGYICGGWTERQAEAIALAIEHPDDTQDSLAQRLGVTRQAVQKRLAGAGWGVLREAAEAFESDEWVP
ncbi:hypothetical protein [Pseudoroseicyclus aestuarii]|uniref:SatD family protein n=1 Tax=Pseudoroseicyclus aestuarii TaxID=1795041 RepID=A0A318SX15_9RHOB|nr:hypothetical protein [Pseudoroseicyclus aestuarii]PYE85875.1 hypothetical protein DFP88_101549 [Pseudoroseicyclus aestuarii]